ncbi:MAG: radical SAM protein [Candidatus Heimdallarchaeota archaeon]|nr:radical SAM protein [Candidatus Heimdallarchaeota archaeon]
MNSTLKKALLITHPTSFKPTKARLIVTQNCPLHCQMCSFWKEKSPEPPLSLIKHWIKECHNFGIKDISIGGGEPFIRSDLPAIVNEIKSYGMTCGITTSGYIHKNIPYANRYEVSIDGRYPSTHDKIRGTKNSWSSALNFIKKVQTRHISKITQINFALQNDNYQELPVFCKYMKTLNLKVSIIPISLHLSAQPSLNKSLGNFNTQELTQKIDEAYEVGNITTNRVLLDLLLDKQCGNHSKQKCLTPFTDILIFADGNVFPCGNIDVSMGILTQDTTLSSLYNSFLKTRLQISNGKHPYCNQKCVYPDISPRDIKTNVKMFVEKFK